jgi:hypothetical protein
MGNVGMDSFLGEMYGTNKTASAASQEDFEKEASVQLFMKLASEQDIPLGDMPDEDVARLYATWVDKTAEFPPKKEGKGEDEDEGKKHEEKETRAKEEHEEKKAAAEKVAEADFLGRVMAHAYVQELQKIAGAEAEGEKEAAMPEALAKGLAKARGVGAGAFKKVVGKGPAMAAHDVGEKVREGAKAVGEHVSRNRGKYEAGGGAALLAGGAAAGRKSKEGSAIDELAAERAVYMAHEGGWDAEQAGRKIASVIELGLVGESVKIAAAADADEAVGIRALEFLEAAGYDVTWNQ